MSLYGIITVSSCTVAGCLVMSRDSSHHGVHGWSVEGLEHDLGHLLLVGLGIERHLHQQNKILVHGDSEIVVGGRYLC